MESLKKNKILLSILGVAILIVIVYFSFFNGSSSTSTSPADTTGTSAMVGSNIVGMLNTINSLSIDTSVFTSTVWTSLHDLSQPLPTNVPGKVDLFSPLSQSNTVSSNQTNIGATQGSQ